MGNKFHHIALRASDFEASTKFYTQGLGFKQVAEWGEGDNRGIMLDIGDGGILEMFVGTEKTNNRVEIYSAKKDCDEVPASPSGEWGHLAIGTENVDEAFRRAIEFGATPTKNPTDLTINATPPMPVRIAFVLGLDGEIIEFFHTY